MNLLEDFTKIVGCAYYEDVGFFIYLDNKEKSTKSFKIPIEVLKHCIFIKLKFCIGRSFVKRCVSCSCNCNEMIGTIKNKIIKYREGHD